MLLSQGGDEAWEWQDWICGFTNRCGGLERGRGERWLKTIRMMQQYENGEENTLNSMPIKCRQ